MDMQEVRRLIYKGEKVDIECKKAGNSVPKSVYESYSGFANTKGGYIFLGVNEDKGKTKPEERFIIQGISNPSKQLEDFWNTINGNKVNMNILKDEDVFIVNEDSINIIVIHVPRADHNMRPVYVGENPYKGTYKRNHEGDYHMPKHEVDAMIRDKNPDGNDSVILEGFTMDDIDTLTLQQYRQRFQVRNPEHVWNSKDDKVFLENLGGYRKDRRTGVEGLTMAGLLMFGKGLAVRDEFDNIFMDYRDQSEKTSDIRWNDRITYDGTWENNLFNFFTKVTPKLTADLKKPFKLENNERIDDTPVHKAIREAFVNLIIHSDYLLDAGTLKIIKLADGYEFTNPGILKLPVNEIFKGGNSKSRNPRMQTMLRMVGFGDNAGSGFPTILNAWRTQGWAEPELYEDTLLNQVTLRLKMIPKWKESLEQLSSWLSANANESAKTLMMLKDIFNVEDMDVITSEVKLENALEKLIARCKDNSNVSMVDCVCALEEIEQSISTIDIRYNGMIEFLKVLAAKLSESAKKSAESAEKSSDKVIQLSDRQEQILNVMDIGKQYSAEDVAALIGLKGPRTRQLLNELMSMNKVKATAITKGRRYMKV